MKETSKELNVSQKKELETSKRENTFSHKYFQPLTDILETDENLTIYMDMAGVSKDRVKVQIEKGILKVDGQIDSNRYSKLKPIYSEYNIGHYTRSFNLSNLIDKDKISAKMEDGVLSLVLPKVPEEKPVAIAVK